MWPKRSYFILSPSLSIYYPPFSISLCRLNSPIHPLSLLLVVPLQWLLCICIGDNQTDLHTVDVCWCIATRRTNRGRSNWRRQYSNSKHPALQSTIFHDFKTAAPRIGMEGGRRDGRGCFNNSGFSNHFNKFSEDIPFRKLLTAILSGWVALKQARC